MTFQNVLYLVDHCKKCGVIFDTAECHRTFIRVISTPTVPYNTPLVWYAHFIFYSDVCSHVWAQPPSLEVPHFMTLFKQKIIATNSALIYCCTFSLLVDSKKTGYCGNHTQFQCNSIFQRTIVKLLSYCLYSPKHK